MAPAAQKTFLEWIRFPFIIQLAGPAVVPLLPLALTVLPAEEILKRLAGMLL